MTDKHLTEAQWKAFVKSSACSDPGLLKALAGLAKAERDGPAEELEALDDIEKQSASTRKANKADKEVLAYLDRLDKALEAQRKLSQKALREAEEASQADEEEDSPALLTTKLLPLVRQVRKGEVVMQALIVSAGKEVAVMLSRRAIAPARAKVLKEYLGASAGTKIIPGECLLEANALTFVVRSQAAGLAKKLKEALFKQTELRLKVRVRGESPDDLDEDGEDTDTPAPQGQSPGGPEAPPAPPDPLKDRFESRLAKLEPLVAAALRGQRGDTGKIRAVADFAREKGESAAYTAALGALDALEKLLVAAGGAAAQPRDVDATMDPAAAFTARLTALMPKVKDALAAGGPAAGDIRLKVSEAGALSRQRQVDAANALLDEVEKLLSGGAASSPAPQADAKAAAPGVMVAYTQSRLAWDQSRKKIQSELRKLEASILDICKDESDIDEIAAGAKQLYEILEYLDERLIDKLDEALNAQDPQARKARNDEARVIVEEYLDFVNSEALLQDIDSNGFVDVAIRSTLNATLAVVGKKLKELNA